VPDDEEPPDLRRENGSRHGVALTRVAVFDVGGPLAAYYLLTAHHVSAVNALILSGIVPAFGIILGRLRDKRVDTIGLVVLFGIIVGSIVGLATSSARLVLLDGTVPTGIVGVVCLASLWAARPVMFRLALEGIGPNTPKGREFDARWRYPGFRHAFRVMTVVWGLVFLAETVLQIIMIETTSISTAKTTSNLMPAVVAAVVASWTFLYGKSQRRKGERMIAAEASREGLANTV
jgi:hypothetical protein